MLHQKSYIFKSAPEMIFKSFDKGNDDIGKKMVLESEDPRSRFCLLTY